MERQQHPLKTFQFSHQCVVFGASVLVFVRLLHGLNANETRLGIGCEVDKQCVMCIRRWLGVATAADMVIPYKQIRYPHSFHGTRAHQHENFCAIFQLYTILAIRPSCNEQYYLKVQVLPITFDVVLVNVRQTAHILSYSCTCSQPYITHMQLNDLSRNGGGLDMWRKSFVLLFVHCCCCSINSVVVSASVCVRCANIVFRSVVFGILCERRVSENLLIQFE